MSNSRHLIAALSTFALVLAPRAFGAEKMGPKKVIAVTSFEYKGQRWDGGDYWSQEQVGHGLQSMLVEALLKTGRFIVVERGEGLGDIQAEQSLKQGGASRGAGAQGGQLMAAQALFRGEITDFTPHQQGAKISTGKLGPLSKIGVGAQNASIAVIVRYFDTTSGQVIDSFQASAKQPTIGFSVEGYYKIPFGTEAFTKTPIGKASNAVVQDVVRKIVAAMENVPFRAKVVKATAHEVTLNAGSDAGLKPGDTFEIFGLGEAIVDPDTGAQLGAEKTSLGMVHVERVQPKFSVAKFETAPSGTPKTGDLAEEAAAKP